MVSDPKTIKVARLAASQPVAFGPLALYNPLLADGDTPIFTGVQTSQPGYVTPVHQHPYMEILFIFEGEAEAWRDGEEDNPIRLGPGDCVAIPADVAHAFRVVGDKPMRLMGIHNNPERIVTYLDSEPGADGAPPVNADIPKSATD